MIENDFFSSEKDSANASKGAIDSHVHFWHYDKSRYSWITGKMKELHQDYLPKHLELTLKRNNIQGVVAMQADQTEVETLFLVELSKTNSIIKGVVGWVDLRSDNLTDRLVYFREFPKLKGFRHIVQGEPAGFLENTKFISGINELHKHGFTYDLLIYHYQMQEALSFVAKIPDTRIVIDHIAKPAIARGEKTQWELNMAAMATFPNIFCKLSGMVTEASWRNWKRDDFYPYLDEVMEAFGPERLMYGSDWPVCLVAAQYREQLDIVRSYISRLSDEEQKAILGENAVAFYGL